jgi:hypothetical protein
MALLSTLVEAIADVEGLDVAFVGGVARYLREAGMISQLVRGRGRAAHRSSQTRSSLLIGVKEYNHRAKTAPEKS